MNRFCPIPCGLEVILEGEKGLALERDAPEPLPFTDNINRSAPYGPNTELIGAAFRVRCSDLLALSTGCYPNHFFSKTRYPSALRNILTVRSLIRKLLVLKQI